MEVDMDVSDILRELIAFLECLHEAKLPLTLESLREKLLIRSKNVLSVTIARSASSDSYLNMSAGSKSLLLASKNETDLQEYVGMESGSQKQIHQDYYETFENESKVIANPIISPMIEKNDGQDQELIRIYKSLSAAQIKSKCHKCGPLYRKVGKKLFLSENRACWIALVGSHLLIYRSERHNRPYAIYPIHGYMVRPAPNLIPHDRQKSESVFEMYCPGNETLHFIARTAKEMEQWIAKICEVACNSEIKNHEKKNDVTECSINSCKDEEERHHNTGKLVIIDNSIANIESTNKSETEQKDKTGRPPPLPARIPTRKLPSLPLDNSILSYKAAVKDDDDDDDDIYHKIEDLKTFGACYKNIVLSKKQRADNVNHNKHKAVAYDDVCTSTKREKDQLEEENSEIIPTEETYDDIVSMTKIQQPNQNHDSYPINNNRNEQEVSYDDVDNLISNEKSAKDQTEISSKSVQKKSFLDRVWSRKESVSGKSEKKLKDKVSSNSQSTLITDKIPMYDDISDLMTNQGFDQREIEESVEYNCPPPPRPICVKSSIVHDLNQTEEFYDDVSVYREQYKKNISAEQQATLHHQTQHLCTKTEEDKDNITCDIEIRANNDLSREEIEHYQSPKSDLCIRDVPEIQQNDELYDDIALWIDFTIRQKDINGKKDEDNAKSMISPDKRSWNRFTVNRKLRLADSNETNRRSSNESEEIEDSLENHGSAKRNTFQRLISRMESSLAKVSVRSPSSLPINKSNTISNNS